MNAYELQFKCVSVRNSVLKSGWKDRHVLTCPSMVMRTDFPGLVTSPQPIIDFNPDVHDLVDFCVDKQYGLESVDFSVYQTSPWVRYRLHNLVYCDLPNKMKNKILGMFSESRPILAVMPRVDFPTRMSRSSSKSLGEQHAMLIVGVNTTSDNFDEHYCVVKNTHGKTWGDGGKSRVAFSVFEYIMCPMYKGRKERDEEEKQKKEMREKKREEKEKEKAEGNNVEENSQGGDAGSKRVEEEHEVRDAGACGSAKMRMIVEEPDDGDDGGVAVGGGSVLKRKKVDEEPEGGGAAAGGGSIKKRNQVDNKQEKGKTAGEGGDMEELGVLAYVQSSE